MRRGFLLICAACAALLPTLLVAGPISDPPEGTAPLTAEGGLGSTQGQSDVTVLMGEVTMRIPKEYFFSPPRHEGHGPDAVDFSLLLLLPDFEPRTAANAAEFVGGWHHQILIGVSYKGYQQTGAALLRTWYRYSNTAKIENGPYGYDVFETPGFDKLFKGTLENPTDIVSCKPVHGPLSGRWPYCERTMVIAPSVTVQYSVSRAYLGSMQSLDSQVIDFLNQFRTSGPQFRNVQ